jgi:hypothetical protein
VSFVALMGRIYNGDDGWEDGFGCDLYALLNLR